MIRKCTPVEHIAAIAALALLVGCGARNGDVAPPFLFRSEVVAVTAPLPPPDTEAIAAEGDALRTRGAVLRAQP